MASLEILLREQRWDEARKELKDTILKGGLMNLICSGEDIPDDILEVLFSNIRFPLRSIAENCLCESPKFGLGCVVWSVSYLERFLRVLLKATKEPIDNPRSCIVRIVNEFTADLVDSLVSDLSSIDDLTSEAHGRVGMSWKRVELLLRASMRGVTDPLDKPLQELPLLAKMVEIKVPKLFVWLVLKLWPEQAKFPDAEYGRLPLHWAAYANNYSDTEDGVLYCCKVVWKDESLIDMLMKVYPEGAAIADKKNGSYPLELLLDDAQYNNNHYIRWGDFTSEWTHRNVMELARQAPQENLVRICPINRMMPFMTASCIPSLHGYYKDYNDPTKRKEMQLHKINLTFALLMENPNSILSGIVSTDREVWLTDKLDKAQKHIQLLETEIVEVRRKLQQQQQQQKQNNPSSSSLPAEAPATATTITTTAGSSSYSFQIYRNIGEADLPPKKRKLSEMDRRRKDDLD